VEDLVLETLPEVGFLRGEWIVRPSDADSGAEEHPCQIVR
jgi:hypothetical protein